MEARGLLKSAASSLALVADMLEDMSEAEHVMAKSKEVMDAELGLVLSSFNASQLIEGVYAYAGPMTHDMVVESSSLQREAFAHIIKAAAAAPTPMEETVLMSYPAWYFVFHPRQHVLSDLQVQDPLAQAAACARRAVEDCPWMGITSVTLRRRMLSYQVHAVGCIH